MSNTENTTNTINTMTNNEEETTMTTNNNENTTKRISFDEMAKETYFGFQKNWTHELITGRVVNAIAYRYPTKDAKKNPHGMFGIVYEVQVQEPNPDSDETPFIVYVNHPMNKLDGHVRKFKELINNDPRISIYERDNVVIGKYIGKGIKAFVRELKTGYRLEYQVNEYYGISFQDEPTYMEDLPVVPDAKEFQKACSDNEMPKERDMLLDDDD